MSPMLTLSLVPGALIGLLAVGLVFLLSSRATTGPLTTDDFDNAAFALLLMTMAVTAAACLAAYWWARAASARIIRPLRELQIEADRLARTDLPRLVETLHSTDGSGEMPAVDLIDIEADGEVADLAHTFNSLRSATVDMVASQAIGRSRDLAGVLVNLGRRNQHLIGRQLQLIDRLEATESDPDMLRHLFTLDQMATRMRRNAESLLVLAGERVERQLQVPQPIDEVLRAAASEIEDYHRVTHAGVEPATISPRAISDLTHLLAELIENATGFSEPSLPVQLMGRWEEHGAYTISVVDEGAGMSRRQLSEANTRITSSTVGTESPTSYLGLFVVGRLAARHNIDARLVEAAPSGTIAKVTLPARLVSERTSTHVEPGTAGAHSPIFEPDTDRSRPPAVESTLAPITGPLPRIKISEPGGPPPAPAPERRPAPDPVPSDDRPVAIDTDLTVPCEHDGSQAEAGDQALPIPPFRTRPSQVGTPPPADGPDEGTSAHAARTPVDGTELDDTQLDDMTLDEPALDDTAVDNTAVDNTAVAVGLDVVGQGEGLEEPLLARSRHPSSPRFRTSEPASHLEVVPEPSAYCDSPESRADQVRDRLAGFSQGVAAALTTAEAATEVDPETDERAHDELDPSNDIDTSSEPDDAEPMVDDSGYFFASPPYVVAVGGTTLPIEVE